MRVDTYYSTYVFAAEHVLISASILCYILSGASVQQAPGPTANRLPAHVPPPSPGEQAAVVEQGLLHVDAALVLRGHDLVVVTPPQLHRRVQVGGGALQGEPVPAENELPLGGDELEEGHLQRSIWKEEEEEKVSL